MLRANIIITGSEEVVPASTVGITISGNTRAEAKHMEEDNPRELETANVSPVDACITWPMNVPT